MKMLRPILSAMLGLAAVVAFAASAIVPASAGVPVASSDMKAICYNFTDHLYMRKCVSVPVEVSAAVAKLNYPSSIVVTRQKDMQRISADWQTSGNCHRAAKKSWTHDDRVNIAKFYYCELNKAGIAVPKPQIIARY